MGIRKHGRTVLTILALSFGSASLQASAENAALWDEWNQLTQKGKNEQFGKFAKRCDDKVMLKKAYDQLAPNAKFFRFLKFVQHCGDVEMIWDAWKQLEAIRSKTDRMPNEAKLPDELKIRVYLKNVKTSLKNGLDIEQIKFWARRLIEFRPELLDALEKLIDVMKF